MARQILQGVDPTDPVLVRDRRRAETLRAERQRRRAGLLPGPCRRLGRIRALHVAEAEVEAAVAAALGEGPFDLLVDLGTGTGRMLELFAPRFRRGIGLDLSPAMLAYARAKLERAGLAHAQVRQGDIYDLPLADQTADAMVMHQVLHFLSDPQRACARRPACWRRAGGCSSSISPRMRWSSCASSTRTSAWASAAAQMRQWLEDAA